MLLAIVVVNLTMTSHAGTRDFYVSGGIYGTDIHGKNGSFDLGAPPKRIQNPLGYPGSYEPFGYGIDNTTFFGGTIGFGLSAYKQLDFAMTIFATPGRSRLLSAEDSQGFDLVQVEHDLTLYMIEWRLGLEYHTGWNGVFALLQRHGGGYLLDRTETIAEFDRGFPMPEQTSQTSSLTNYGG